MATWRATLADNSEDMCSSCFDNKKYVCIEYRMSICNKCSTFENNEDTGGLTAGRSVGHREPCLKAKKLLEENSDGGKRNNERDRTNSPDWKYVLNWWPDKTLTPSPWTSLMDYPNGLPLKLLFNMSTMLRSCDNILTLHEPAYFRSAWPAAAILNNYTE